jgi:hypothetical protein
VVAVAVHDMLAVVVPVVTSPRTMLRSLVVTFSESLWVLAVLARVRVVSTQKVAQIRN